MRAVTIAACQAPEIREDVESALSFLETQASKAPNASLLLLPEGFLQGYLIENEAARRQAINLSSPRFKAILRRLAPLKPMLIFGLIELENNQLFNSAVVVHHGQLVGVYRKTHLLPGEAIFEPGSSYPVFEVDGLKFGINICADMRYPEAAAAVAAQQAHLILCPANNMLPRATAEKWKHRHHELRAERARETSCWIVSADVTGQRDGRIGYGPTSAINPEGQVVAQASLGRTSLVTINIDL